MSRKERRERYEDRKRDILAEVAQIAADVVKEGGTTREAILKADRWLVEKVRSNPQESQIYRDAAREYLRELKAEIKRTKHDFDTELG